MEIIIQINYNKRKNPCQQKTAGNKHLRSTKREKWAFCRQTGHFRSKSSLRGAPCIPAEGGTALVPLIRMGEPMTRRMFAFWPEIPDSALQWEFTNALREEIK